MPRKKSGNFDQSKYIQQFMKEKVTVKRVTFNKETDTDLLAWLAGKKFSSYVKELIRNDMKEGLVMTYKIKAEYLDRWEGGDTPSDPDRIITQDELEQFSKEWGIPVDDLLEQLIPQD